MTGFLGFMKHLRRVPEPFKRRLRPALVRTVGVARALPGGRMAFALAGRLAPGARAWVLQRYLHYVDSAIGQPVEAPRSELADLDIDAQIVAGWIRRIGAQRVN
jgi:hypothetical protein